MSQIMETIKTLMQQITLLGLFVFLLASCGGGKPAEGEEAGEEYYKRFLKYTNQDEFEKFLGIEDMPPLEIGYEGSVTRAELVNIADSSRLKSLLEKRFGTGVNSYHECDDEKGLWISVDWNFGMSMLWVTIGCIDDTILSYFDSIQAPLPPFKHLYYYGESLYYSPQHGYTEKLYFLSSLTTEWFDAVKAAAAKSDHWECKEDDGHFYVSFHEGESTEDYAKSFDMTFYKETNVAEFSIYNPDSEGLGIEASGYDGELPEKLKR